MLVPLLKPGGVLYVEAPFMKDLHRGAYDFTRFADLGRRWVWRRFEEIDRGVIGGPGLSLCRGARHCCRTLRGHRRRTDVTVVGLLLGLSLVDRFLPLEREIEGANGMSFLGGKVEQSSPREDRISRYLGPAF